MAQEDVNIKVTADMAEAIRAWKEMQKGPQQLAEEMSRMSQKGRKANRALNKSITAQAGSWFKAQLGVMGATRAIELYRNEVRQVGQEAQAAGLKVGLFITKLRIQQGLTNPKAAKAQVDRAATIGQQIGVSTEVALATQTELISQGFTPDSLRVALESQVATNQGRDAGTAVANVRAQGQFLQAAGLKKNAANLRKLAVNTTSLFRSDPLQPDDLIQFANAMSDFVNVGGFTPDEAMAAVSTLSKSVGPRRATTQLRNIVTTLSSTAGNIKKQKALRRLGINPKDVDFIGETPLQVSAELGRGIAATDRETVNAALLDLFGKENIGGALLFSRTDQLRATEAKLGNKEPLATGVEIFGASRGAEHTRSENRILAARAARNEAEDEIKEFRERQLDNRKLLDKVPVVGSVRRDVSDTAFTELRRAGVSGTVAEDVIELTSRLENINPVISVINQGRAAAKLIGDFFSGDDDDSGNNITINVNAKLTNERGAEVGNVSAVQGANEDE